MALHTAYAFTAFFTFLPPPNSAPAARGQAVAEERGKGKGGKRTAQAHRRGARDATHNTRSEEALCSCPAQIWCTENDGPQPDGFRFFFGLVDSLGHGPPPAPGPPR